MIYLGDKYCLQKEVKLIDVVLESFVDDNVLLIYEQTMCH